MSNLMKTIFDSMRKNAEFRARVEASVAPLNDPILHAVDCNDKIGDVVRLAATRSKPLYIFVFNRNCVARGFSLAVGTGEQGDAPGEAPAPIHPDAPVGMVLDHAERAGELNFVLFADRPEGAAETSMSHLVMS